MRHENLAAAGGWPYDADPDDPLTALRIPVTSAHPQWSYLLTFDRLSVRPTGQETRTLWVYLDYLRSRFRSSWRARLLLLPLDIDDSFNTVILRKTGPTHWLYRYQTWTASPSFVPGAGLGLLALLSLLPGGAGQGWARWKRELTDLIGGLP